MYIYMYNNSRTLTLTKDIEDNINKKRRGRSSIGSSSIDEYDENINDNNTEIKQNRDTSGFVGGSCGENHIGIIRKPGDVYLWGDNEL